MASLILQAFTKKFPLTGTKCQVVEVEEDDDASSSCGTAVTINTPDASTVVDVPTSVPPLLHPADIQQRLEELLLKKKERRMQAVVNYAAAMRC